MTHIVNYQNCDLVTGFLDELPTTEQQASETRILLGTLAPYVPRTELERILEAKRRASNILHAPVHGENVVDRSTGAVTPTTFLPEEGK